MTILAFLQPTTVDKELKKNHKCDPSSLVFRFNEK